MIKPENTTVADQRVETTSISNQEALDFILDGLRHKIEAIKNELRDKEEELENTSDVGKRIRARLKDVEVEIFNIRSILSDLCGEDL